MSRRNQLRAQQERAARSGKLRSHIGIGRLALGYVGSLAGLAAGVVGGVKSGIDETWGVAFYFALAVPFVPMMIFLALLGTRPWLFATAWWLDGASIDWLTSAPRNGSYRSLFANRDFYALRNAYLDSVATRRDGSHITLPRFLWSQDGRRIWKLEPEGRLSVEEG